MKPSERGRRHQIAKLRLEVKELRRALRRMEAHIRMQDEKIALLARRPSVAPPLPPRYPYPHPRRIGGGAIR